MAIRQNRTPMIPLDSLQWEKITSPDLAQAVKKTQGVCIVPIGCLERHNGHLPLGTDTLLAQAFVQEAIKIEPAVVFPPLYFGWIHEAKHHPGAIAFPASFMFELLEHLCGEIARNGFKKIIIVNGHGSNQIAQFRSMMLEKPRDYTLYEVGPGDVYPADEPTWQRMRVIANDGHAGDDETSVFMAAHPELVKMNAVTKPSRDLRRLVHLKAVKTAMGWYANHPDCYSGDARNANLKKGKYLFDYAVRCLSTFIGLIKKDKLTAKFQKEFFARCQH